MAKQPKPKNIGIKVAIPQKFADDPRCPFYGNLKVRGRKFTGTVVSDKMNKTATVQWTRYKLLTKYDRYEQKITKVHAHNPDSIGAKKGDKVVIMETRPLSKTKSFVIVEKLGRDIDYEIKEQSIEVDSENISEKEKRKQEADKTEPSEVPDEQGKELKENKEKQEGN